MNAPASSESRGAPSGRSMMAAGLALCLPAAAGEALSGGSYRLVGGPVSGGGATSGGSLHLSSTAGDVAPGSALGGTFTLAGSLYSVEVISGDYSLTIEDLGDGRLQIEWPASATGYVLESVPALGDPTLWEPVAPSPQGSSHLITTATATQQFFRLKRP
ncbi:MAG: hypothetical protein J0L84_16090 [Verrucomicrobia bacterium]|nr:hypothetical protein [Verrucomicrobiota bacterium]